jgi:hypothetical protein
MKKEKATEVECSICKKGMSNSQIWITILAVYMLIAAVYGTIEIVKNIMSLF